ncbi:hypothetical protein [Streptomyces aurantiacus]|uniref:hypothetical protein n=1 Tax=Streptomyces aurantiacus TaxID=47760 RepID=UPI000B276853|nr:hypothetical protein [Streptomyces aurantiacus]
MGEREGDDPRPNDRTTRPGHSEDFGHSERSEHSGYAGQQAEPSGDPSPGVRPDVGAALAAAVRGGAVDPDAEKRALAAFRQARDEGAYGEARTRRRDDWRPDGERRGGWSLRTTLIALAASVTLGGVAVAAIGSGSGTPDEEGERDRPRPSSTAPAESGTDAGAPGASGPAGPGRTDGSDGSSDDSSGRPSTAQDTVAHCRAYDSVKERGKALESTAWQRLILAAGGEDNVEAYCAAQLAEAKAKEKKNTQKAEPTKSAKPSRTPGNGTTKNPKSTKSTKSAKNSKSAKSKGG